MSKSNSPFHPSSFKRKDESDDALFYQLPRLLIHVDEHASRALAEYFGELLPGNGNLLDLMSAYRSHLPAGINYTSVTGLGMNEEELSNNKELTGHLVHDLNKSPKMPFEKGQFDACILSFSFQYLTKPVEVLADVARVLKPGCTCHIAYSNRLFPTKAVFLWQVATDPQKGEYISVCLGETGLFDAPETVQLVAPGEKYDPLYVLRAMRKE